MQKLKLGDVVALEALFFKYGTALRAYAFQLTHSMTVVDDLVSDTFLKVYESVSAGANIYHLKAYLYTTCRNLAMDRFRSNVRLQRLPEEQANENETDDSIARISLLDALTQLTLENREIVMLHCVSGLKHREIAQMLNIPEGTVRWKYRDALCTLKKLLGDDENE